MRLEVDSDDFARRFALRPGQLMWFLGAGASVSAGVPTAWDMIWQFKQILYAAQRRVPLATIADTSNPSVRALLNAHVSGSGSLPPPGAPDEYAALFEAAYPAEKDRRTFIDGMIGGAKPAYGHLALAALFKAGHAHLVWTTNFDHLVADACAQTYGTTKPLSVIALDAPELAAEKINAQQWPIEIKLHGDFRSRRLKNTSDELRHQDAQLRDVFVDSCRRAGLIVGGYSGRDASIMDAFEAALERPGAFPGGLFWLHRGEDEPFDRVTRLLELAHAAGVDCGLVRIENLDEALRDLVRLLPDLDTTALDSLGQKQRWWTAAPALTGKHNWPLVRLNGIEVESIPTNARRIVCGIGGAAEVRDAILAASADLIATRTSGGVIGFGSDQEFRRVFAPFDIEDFDLSVFEDRRLRYDSGERGLLRDALVRGLCRAHGLNAKRRRNIHILAPHNPIDEQWAPLRALVGPVRGQLDGGTVQWREGLGIRLDWADDRLWLLVDPRIDTEDDGSVASRAKAADFARERTARRYNRDADKLIDFWTGLFAGENVRALEIGDGIDASFSLGRRTAFSYRVTP